jgi:uncharacterized protein (UPF0210 family)
MKLAYGSARITPIVFLLCALSIAATAQETASTRPSVRAITAFIHIDRDHYQTQFADAVTMLKAARKSFEHEGWTVQTVRIVTQPFPDYIRGLPHDQALEFLKQLDILAQKNEFRLAIGPAMTKDSDDPAMMDILAEFLAPAKSTNATTIIAAEDGVHWKAIQATARLVKYLENNSTDSHGNFNFTAAAMMPEYTPFFPAAIHTGAGHRFAVGLESANVVDHAFAATKGDPAAASARLKTDLAHYAKLAEASAQVAAEQSGWEYMGLDPTPAPMGDVSIGAAIEHFTGHHFGSSGTLTAARIITEAVKSVPVKQVGYAGLMLPVLEDGRIAERWSSRSVTIDALLAYSSVCATGLDLVPLPGDVSEEQLARILGDVASLAYKWKKPLTARLLPIKGKSVGDKSDFHDQFMGNAVLQPLP